ncbi:MAG: threonine dehydrogenase [Acidimicrobiales bacterium]|nr:threonine dehydrogenase [Acidimicrobiales bacterium]
MTRFDRAAVLIAPRRADVVRVRSADPGPHEVRVAVEGCGVCGSNLALWQGRPWFEYPRPPGAPGHEAWGEIDAVGAEVSTVRCGDRVALLSRCAFADRALVDAGEVVVLAPALAGAAFPGEALGCAWNVARRSGFTAGQTVTVVGVGFLGAVTIALATAAGARVIAVSRRPFALATARAMGAVDTVELGEQAATIAAVVEIAGGALCDIVVEAVGSQWALDLAGALTKVGGRLVIAGFHQDGDRSVDLQLWGWRGIDVVNAHERDPQVVLDGVRAAAELVAAGVFDPAPLLTHRYALDQLGEALAAVESRPDGFLKALVCP